MVLRLHARTIIGIAVFLFSFIPDVSFWKDVGSRYAVPVYKFLGTPIARMLLGVCGIALIWFDQRRLTRKQKAAHDLATLKGRTLKLRDDMQAFLDSVPRASGYLGTSQEGTIERLRGASISQARLEHGFYLYFDERVRRIWHEFGERGVQDKVLTRLLAEKKYEQLITYKEMIDAFTRLAACPEANSAEASISAASAC